MALILLRFSFMIGRRDSLHWGGRLRYMAGMIEKPELTITNLKRPIKNDET
jgi:hypothetical protein